MRVCMFLFAMLMGLGFCSAQNYLFEDGQSGTHIGLGGSVNGGTVLLALVPGFTVNGRYTAEAGFATTLNAIGSNNLILTSSLSALLLKQGEVSPVSLGGSIGLQNVFLRGEDLRTFVYGPSIHYEIQFNEWISVIPTARVLFNNELGNSIRSTFSTTSLSAAFKVDSFYFEPTFNINRGFNQLFLSLGYLFPRS